MYDRRRILIIGGAAALLLALAGGTIAVLRPRPPVSEVMNEAESTRLNTLRLAREYFEAGELQRALDLVDRILIGNADDRDARALKAEILEVRRLAQAEAERNASGVQSESMDGYSVTWNLADATERLTLTEAMQESLRPLRRRGVA